MVPTKRRKENENDFRKDEAGEVFLKDFLLKDAIPDDYRGYVVNEILSDVCEDIDASADEEFSDGDVRLALGRVLCDRLGIEVG